MKLDKHLIAGITLGVFVGLHFSAQLAPYAIIFMIAAVVLVLRYVLGVK